MSPRKYEQRLRAETAEQTRRNILDAVGARLREAPTEPLSLDKVARSAGVSRSTIYDAYGSRAGLLDAFVADLWDRSGIATIAAAPGAADGRGHLRAGLEASVEMMSADLEIYRALHAMDRLDPDSSAGAVRHMEKDRRDGMEVLARRLDDEHLLRDDVTAEWAAHLLWVLTSFESVDLLIAGRGLKPVDAVDLLFTAADRTLCRPRRRR